MTETERIHADDAANILGTFLARLDGCPEDGLYPILLSIEQMRALLKRLREAEEAENLLAFIESRSVSMSIADIGWTTDMVGGCYKVDLRVRGRQRDTISLTLVGDARMLVEEEQDILREAMQ